jgi:hypothetical protein
MLPLFLIEETTVRESGESPIFTLGERTEQPLLLTLGITHAVEHENMDVDFYVSEDGRKWPEKPALSFPKKCYCGTYQLLLPEASGRFLKAVWRVSRWGKDNGRPFFRFYVFAQPVRSRAMAGAA